jgi:hypothetical protein
MELTFQKISSYRPMVIGVCGNSKSPLRSSTDSQLLHQASHPVASHSKALGQQLGMEPRRAIGLTALLKDLLNLEFQLLILLAAVGRFSMPPGIESAAGDAQDLAH